MHLVLLESHVCLVFFQVDQDILDNLEWQARKSDGEIRAGREKMLESLEWASAQQRESGSLERWWSGVDPEIRLVAGTICFSLVYSFLSSVRVLCVLQEHLGRTIWAQHVSL